MELKRGVWAYLAPIGVLCTGVVLSSWAFHEHKATGFLVLGTVALFFIGGGLWMLVDISESRLILSPKEILYIEGEKRISVSLDQVEKVGIYRFYIQVDLRQKNPALSRKEVSPFLSGKEVVLIPVSFRSSEVVLALLGRAARNNKGGMASNPSPPWA
jgi:hypothetical protein